VSEAHPGPAQWRRSRHSGSTGGQCVEVAAFGDGLVRIRDSKDPAGPQILISAACWRSCLPGLPCLTGPAVPAGDCLCTAFEGDWVLLRRVRQPGSPSLRFTPGEWDVFLRGARDGDFDLTADGRLRPPPLAGHLPELSARRAGARTAMRSAVQAGGQPGTTAGARVGARRVSA
jgi:Domain of unknown function (DUF397)